MNWLKENTVRTLEIKLNLRNTAFKKYIQHLEKVELEITTFEGETK